MGADAYYWPATKIQGDKIKRQLATNQYYVKIITDALDLYLLANPHRRHCFGQ